MIRVIQADNRPSFDILNLTRAVNEKVCAANQGWRYEFHTIDDRHTLGGTLHPATAKIPFMNEILATANHNDIIVFLDSDAWIHNGKLLKNIIDKLNATNKQGCFSRDPYYDHNTFVNSGSFVLRVSEYTRNMYKKITEECVKVPWDYVNISLKIPKEMFDSKPVWPYDQHYISKFVYENRNEFIVFDEYVMNTPLGLALRHNWLKADKLYRDVTKKLEGVKGEVDTSCVNLDDAIDLMPFPNTRKEEAYWPYFYSDEYEDTVLRKFKLKRLL